MKHVMIDLETLGTKHNSVFLSMAAVSFELDIELLNEDAKIFTAQIDLQSALEAGLTVDAATVEWWMRQDTTKRKLMFEGTTPLETVLKDFYSWWHMHEGIYPWGNSASFDLGILTNAYQRTGVTRLPWKYANERCFRTAIALFPVVGVDRENAHDPLADCHYQIKKLQLAYQANKNRR